MALGGTIDVLTTDNPDGFSEEPEELQIYEKHNNLLHGNKRKKYGSREFFFFYWLFWVTGRLMPLVLGRRQ